MSKSQMLRLLVEQRLTAAAEEIFMLFERTIAEYEEELCRSKEENDRQRELLDAVFKPQVRLHRADDDELLLRTEEVPEQQQWSSGVDQEDPESPHIKEEQEELWSSQEGEQLQGPEEADVTRFSFTPVPVKREDDEEKPHQSPSEENTETQPPTEDDGDHCGGSEAARTLDLLSETHADSRRPNHPQPQTENLKDWRDVRYPLKHVEKSKLYVGCQTEKKQYICSECGKRFGCRQNLKRHVRIHTGEKPYSCFTCGKRFTQKVALTRHLVVHTGEKLFGCSVCNKRFSQFYQIKKHKCVVEQRQLPKSPTEENTETQPPTSSSTPQMETEADGDDGRGSEAASNGDPLSHAEDRASDFSDPESDDSEDDWIKHINADSNFNSATNKQSFVCSECDRTFGHKRNLKRHMRIHTGEKPFVCSFCSKSFRQRSDLVAHFRIHTGEKPFSCAVCQRSFRYRSDISKHMRVHASQAVGDSETTDLRCHVAAEPLHALTSSPPGQT